MNIKITKQTETHERKQLGMRLLFNIGREGTIVLAVKKFSLAFDSHSK
jgi:hypothetical protein